MWYYLTYYLKKFWYIPVLLIMILFLYVVLSMNKGELIYYFEKFENKVSYTPEQYVEENIDDVDSYLDKLKVSAPYLGNSLTPYVPSNLDENEKKAYLREFEKDPDYVYKKNISWSTASITDEEFMELMELVGYHLNKNSNNTTIVVSKPTIEQLAEYEQQVMYYTDDDGVLYLNLYVEEINTSSSTVKTYVYTYRLKYDLEGKINIS